MCWSAQRDSKADMLNVNPLSEEIHYCLNLCFNILLLSRYYAKLKKMEEEREQELASKYRDRVSNGESRLEGASV